MPYGNVVELAAYLSPSWNEMHFRASVPKTKAKGSITEGIKEGGDIIFIHVVVVVELEMGNGD